LPLFFDATALTANNRFRIFGKARWREERMKRESKQANQKQAMLADCSSDPLHQSHRDEDHSINVIRFKQQPRPRHQP
jgi:hypothetical protein